ncbi:hypothetical protein KIPB_012253 [Kipferlia bialata]|uniref:Uncharacterized protein n=1 Tax=Kipferlia bialata TaxID=797122 RepID=A0A9K3D9F3_9EUKA|nr:hypothetical protein KIPB_012253 [Kipferlia bialata]|eukprot:g12253.t1
MDVEEEISDTTLRIREIRARLHMARHLPPSLRCHSQQPRTDLSIPIPSMYVPVQCLLGSALSMVFEPSMHPGAGVTRQMGLSECLGGLLTRLCKSVKKETEGEGERERESKRARVHAPGPPLKVVVVGHLADIDPEGFRSRLQSELTVSVPTSVSANMSVSVCTPGDGLSTYTAMCHVANDSGTTAGGITLQQWKQHQSTVGYLNEVPGLTNTLR